MARKAARHPGLGSFARYWLPVVAYVGLILILSAQPNMRSPLQFANGDKVAHVLEYLGLGALLARALRSVPALGAPLAAGLVALILGMVVGIGDELFQSTVPGRSMSALDFGADTLGLLLAQIATLALARR